MNLKALNCKFPPKKHAAELCAPFLPQGGATSSDCKSYLPVTDKCVRVKLYIYETREALVLNQLYYWIVSFYQVVKLFGWMKICSAVQC